LVAAVLHGVILTWRTAEAVSTVPKKFKPIPPVPFNLIIKGHEQITADHEKYGSAEPTVSLVRALAADHNPEEILAVSYRLGALAKLIKEGEGKPWTFAVTQDNYHMVNEALFRAAARAPLMEAKTVGEVAFDPKIFTPIALEEAESEGNA
jgi:hypothetical protein